MRFCLGLTLAAMLTLAACGKKPEAVSARQEGPPHGGTPVVIGDDEYHIEFVLDPATGTLSAYLFDEEMEEFVRSDMASFELTATVGGTARTLVFKPVANPATGETVGDTALFTAQADWLKTTKEFNAVIQSVTLDGTRFTGIDFNFPRGNETD